MLPGWWNHPTGAGTSLSGVHFFQWALFFPGVLPLLGIALEAKAVPRRPLKLGGSERAHLERMLLLGALRAGYSTNLWTCPGVRELIAREFHVEYHVDHISRLLRFLGWSPQQPKRRARERDEGRIQGWIRTVWPRVKKSPAD